MSIKPDSIFIYKCFNNSSRWNLIKQTGIEDLRFIYELKKSKEKCCYLCPDTNPKTPPEKRRLILKANGYLAGGRLTKLETDLTVIKDEKLKNEKSTGLYWGNICNKEKIFIDAVLIKVDWKNEIMTVMLFLGHGQQDNILFADWKAGNIQESCNSCIKSILTPKNCPK